MTAPLCDEFNHLNYPASPNFAIYFNYIAYSCNHLYYVFIVCCLACLFLLSLLHLINNLCVSIIWCSLCLFFIFNEIQGLMPAELGKDLWKSRGIGRYVFLHWKCKSRSLDIVIKQRSTKIAVEGMIFDFGFSKKYDLSLLSIEGWVLDWCRAFDGLASVDAHLCWQYKVICGLFILQAHCAHWFEPRQSLHTEWARDEITGSIVKVSCIMYYRYIYLCICCFYGARHNAFDVGTIHDKGHWKKGGGPENRDFFGPLNGNEGSECHLGHFQAPPPFQWPKKWMVPTSKS